MRGLNCLPSQPDQRLSALPLYQNNQGETDVDTRVQIFCRCTFGRLRIFGSAVSTAVAAEPEVVRFGWFGGPRIWTIGKATGMFDKGMGTKVEWVQFPSGAAALTSLAAKQVDISRLGSTPTVAAIARKLPIEVSSLSTESSQTSERLIAKSGINSVAELKGKRIAYPPGSTAHYALMAALKVNNIAAEGCHAGQLDAGRHGGRMEARRHRCRLRLGAVLAHDGR